MGYSQLGAISKPLSHKVTAWELISAIHVNSGMANKPSEIAVDVRSYTFVYCQWYVQNGDGSTYQPALRVNISGGETHSATHFYNSLPSSPPSVNEVVLSANGAGSDEFNLVKGVLPTDGWGVSGYFLYAKPLASSVGHLIGYAGGDSGDADLTMNTLVSGLFPDTSEPMTVLRFPDTDDCDNFSAQLWGVR